MRRNTQRKTGRSPIPVSNPIWSLLPTDIEGLDALAELALDVRWSGSHGAEEVWRQLDPDLWDLTHNPWGVLQAVSRDRIERMLSDPAGRERIDDLLRARRQAAEAPAWFQHAHAASPPISVAYFSMEYMLSEALPIYSGGLGNVAGDQLKAASDLGVPVVAVGLLYQQGYFRQVIDKDGAQQALFPYNDPGQLPITAVRRPNGEWLRLEIALPGYSVWLRAWQVRIGTVTLYLLDSNDAANVPSHRGITSELYGGGPELRLVQEIVLGIGGWRLLGEIGIRPDVCHLNEGHAAFAILERTRGFMKDSGQPFDVALAVTRAGNLFTTHTAVDAGFDRCAPALIEQYLGGYVQAQLGITLHELLALGRRDPADASEPFNMAYLAMHGCGRANGVSRLHGQVSRHLFAPLFPGWPDDEVPVGHVSNGIHVPTWQSTAADELWTEACGNGRWMGAADCPEKALRRLPGPRLWQLRAAATASLIDFARERLARQLTASGATAEAVDQAKALFDPNALTLGFARRFAAYKRPNLLLHDPDRLLRLLSSRERPVQIIIAGKAHPADEAGQALIQQWIRFSRRPDVRPYVIFLSDYDMLLTRRLVQGVDVWINTPRRPWEASGTSGMKTLVNGGLNLSELDGWWAEAYGPDLGWAVGDGQDPGDDSARDAAEAQELYDVLERAVVPEFYTRDATGIPIAWIARMRESMARLTPRFSADRTVREYTERHYLPAAAAFRARAADGGALGRQVVSWMHVVEQQWAALGLDVVKVETDGMHHAFDVRLNAHDLDPDTLRVELYANGVNGDGPFRQEMTRVRRLEGRGGGYAYHARVPAARPAKDYTARAVPYHEGVAVPLEDARILWQR
jgi:glycogen phosphorylase